MEASDVASPDGADEGKELSKDDSDDLKVLGFDPGIPVYAINYFSFDLDLFVTALFGCKASNPAVVTLVYEQIDSAVGPMNKHEEWAIPMIVESVRVFYPAAIMGLDQRYGLGCLENPEWYVRGWMQKAPLDPDQQPVRIHAYVRVKEAGSKEIEMIRFQLVRTPSGADLSTTLRSGRGIPGQV